MKKASTKAADSCTVLQIFSSGAQNTKTKPYEENQIMLTANLT